MKLHQNGIESKQLAEPETHEQILERIALAIDGVRFGSVEVVIQDSKVVQIERKEKFRFDKGARR